MCLCIHTSSCVYESILILSIHAQNHFAMEIKIVDNNCFSTARQYCYRSKFCCRNPCCAHSLAAGTFAADHISFAAAVVWQHITACHMQRAALIIASVCCCCLQFNSSWLAQKYTHFQSRLKCIPISCMRKLPRIMLHVANSATQLSFSESLNSIP